MIYVVTTQSRWKTALDKGYHETESLATEGFIHASKEGQVKGVLERHFRNQNDLVLLHIDERLLKPELKYELAPSVNELFPHIFGRLNTDAVIKTTPL